MLEGARGLFFEGGGQRSFFERRRGAWRLGSADILNLSELRTDVPRSRREGRERELGPRGVRTSFTSNSRRSW